MMLIYDGAELTRILNKVLSKNCSLLHQSLVNNHERITEPIKLPFFCEIGVGLNEIQRWLDTDIVACLQSFFIQCQKGEWLQDPEVLFFEYTIGVLNV